MTVNVTTPGVPMTADAPPSSVPDATQRFLEALPALASADEHRAVDAVFDYLDDLLLAGRFSDYDAVFQAADPAVLPPALVVPFLMVTRRAASRLPTRSVFLDRAISALAAVLGAAEAEALLGKYR